MTSISQALYVGINTYALALFFIKFSLLLFYRRVFMTKGQTNHTRRMKMAIYAVGIYVTAAYLASQISYIFLCWPIHFWWDTAYVILRLRSPSTVKCLNLIPRSVSLAVINIASDFFILLLPMLGLRSLHLPLRRKITFFFVFALGGL